MAEQKFHQYSLLCPDCRNPLFVDAIAFRADGVIRIEAICTECEEQFFNLIEISQALSWCSIYDDFPVNVKDRWVIS